MKKKIFLFLFIGISFHFFSCKKEIIEPTINHVNFSEKVIQIDFDTKPSFEVSYSDNNIIDGEITLQLLDETGTLLHFLPNSNLLEENGVIHINEVSGLKNNGKYFLKIENYYYNNSYYCFLIENDTTYKDVLFIPFTASINKNIENIFIKTFDMLAVDSLGPQMALIYGSDINNNGILFRDLNIYIYTKEKPWNIFKNVYIRDADDYFITQRPIGRENSWIQHNDSTYQININNIFYSVSIGDFVQKINFEILNGIEPKKIQIKIKNHYQDNYSNEIKIFETKKDSLRIVSPTK